MTKYLREHKQFRDKKAGNKFESNFENKHTHIKNVHYRSQQLRVRNEAYSFT